MRFAIFLSSLALSLAACGGDDDAGADGGPDTGTADAGGSDGGTDGGRDAGPPLVCPDELPAEGDPCTGEGLLRCYYERCPEGLYRAECGPLGFEILMDPCTDYDCMGTSCMGDQLCVIRQGGALLVECQDNPCGEQAITEECACALCGVGPECTLTGTTVTCQQICEPEPCA
jgi:hypothetical protein